MFKKILSSMISVCILLGMFTSLSFAAVAEDVQIEQAKKAIKDGAASLNIVNDTTSDEFLREVKLLLPEGSEVNLAFSKETDYRIYNATSEKDGSVFVNIEFTCGPYKTHEMYDIKIAKLTGAAAEANADRENLTKDAALVKAAFSNMSFANTITEEEILEKARAAVQNGSTVTSKGDFTKVDATETKRGSA